MAHQLTLIGCLVSLLYRLINTSLDQARGILGHSKLSYMVPFNVILIFKLTRFLDCSRNVSNRRLYSHGYLADDSTSSLLEFASSALSFQALYEYLVSGFVSVYSRFFNERQTRLRMPGIHYCCSTYPSAHAVPYY